REDERCYRTEQNEQEDAKRSEVLVGDEDGGLDDGNEEEPPHAQGAGPRGDSGAVRSSINRERQLGSRVRSGSFLYGSGRGNDTNNRWPWVIHRKPCRYSRTTRCSSAAI